MTPTETKPIEEMNEVIALFEGRKKTIHDNLIFWSDVEQQDEYNLVSGELCYHCSWDRLMPVVQKILITESTPFDPYILWVSDSLKTADIKFVYAAVCDFLESYNSQNKQP